MRRAFWALSLALIVSPAFAVSIIGWVGVPLTQANDVMVPDITGGDSTAANAALASAGLAPGTVGQTCSAEMSGIVIAQDPAAGASVAAGSKVNYTTSSGVACAGRSSGVRIGLGIGIR